MTTSKESTISFVGLIIAIILALFSSGIANWGMRIFLGISRDIQRGELIAVAIIIGQTIAAFANKKYL